MGTSRAYLIHQARRSEFLRGSKGRNRLASSTADRRRSENVREPLPDGKSGCLGFIRKFVVRGAIAEGTFKSVILHCWSQRSPAFCVILTSACQSLERWVSKTSSHS